MASSKNFFAFWILLFGFFVVTGCETEKSVVQEAPIILETEEEEMAEEVMEVIEEEVVQPLSDEPVTETGYFRSVRGVMDKLSCYCENGGYLESAAGKTSAVCLENTVLIPDGAIVEVTGKMELKSVQSSGGPCLDGSMTFIRVESYKILSE